MKPPTLPLTVIAPLIAATFLQQSIFSAEIDENFAAHIGGAVHSLVIDSQGKILAGGEFTTVNATSRANIVRLNSDGEIDNSFTTVTDGVVLALAADPAGNIFAAGAFNSPGRHLLKILPDGSQSPLSLGASTSSRIDCLAVGADGSAAIGGPFRRLDGSAAVNAAKLTSGSLIDLTFSSALLPSMAIEAGADAIALQPDGKVIIGGSLNTSAGGAKLIRLNADGSLDNTFSGDHGPILYAKAINLLDDGRVLVAGIADSSGAGFIRRLNSDGTVDESFEAPEFNGSVEAIAVDSNAGIIVGGSFEGSLARLDSNGALDQSWDLSADGVVKAIALQGEDAIVVGGSFQHLGDRPHSAIGRIILNGKVSILATNSNGRFRARIQGEAGKSYEVQASADLRSWKSIGNVVATEVGIEIEDEPGPMKAARFFRARLLN